MITTVVWLAGISIVAAAIILMTRTISHHDDLCVVSSTRSSVRQPQPRHTMHEEDLIDEAGAESFPASDPPARSPIVGVGRRDQ